MATEVYLAMSSEEIAVSEQLPARLGWIDCCFSQTKPGLDLLPPALPPDSLLILTDRLPFRGHDPSLIAEQLHQTAASLGCAAVLLDFETPEQESLATLAEKLVSTLPCPVSVSKLYAQNLDCPVFLPPCPHHIRLEEYISPWKGRVIWLDLARDAEVITVTSSGSLFSPISWFDTPYKEHTDQTLYCHYRIEISGDRIQFMLRRTREDLEGLMHQAETLGIQHFVGLYQEWI